MLKMQTTIVLKTYSYQTLHLEVKLAYSLSLFACLDCYFHIVCVCNRIVKSLNLRASALLFWPVFNSIARAPLQRESGRALSTTRSA